MSEEKRGLVAVQTEEPESTNSAVTEQHISPGLAELLTEGESNDEVTNHELTYGDS